MRSALRLTRLQLTTVVLLSVVLGAAASGAGRTLLARADASPRQEPAQKAEVSTAKGRPVIHFEIGCKDTAKTKEFYARLFDWQIKGAGMTANIQTGGGKGIDGHITALGHEPEHYVTFYVEVEDIKASLEKVTALGGKVVVPAVKIPTGQFAWLADPDGNIIGLIQSNK